jgi:hypothetical protein
MVFVSRVALDREHYSCKSSGIELDDYSNHAFSPSISTCGPQMAYNSGNNTTDVFPFFLLTASPAGSWLHTGATMMVKPLSVGKGSTSPEFQLSRFHQ